MRGLVAIACLSALVAMISGQTVPPAATEGDGSSLATTCAQVCGQGCHIWNQVMSVFAIFFGPLGPFVSTGYTICTQSCGVICGFL